LEIETRHHRTGFSQLMGAEMVTKGDQAGDSIFLTSDRLASLSDTMFGVAMALVVTTLLPSVQAYKGAVIGVLPNLNGELIAIVLSFAISARYWVFQQQRLAMTSTVTPLQTLLHLTFLFLVVLIPISTSLSGLTGSGARLVPVMIYGSHLFLLALVNLLLWVEVHRDVGAHLQIVQSSIAVSLLVAALAVAAMRPSLALYVWFTVPTTPLLLSRHLTRQIYGIKVR
jgi:uncharacterized membrane protein